MKKYSKPSLRCLGLLRLVTKQIGNKNNRGRGALAWQFRSGVLLSEFAVTGFAYSLATRVTG